MTHFVCLSIFFFGCSLALPGLVAPRRAAAYLELEFRLYQLHNVGPGARLVDVDRLIRLAAADEAGALQALRAGGGHACCRLWRHGGHRLCLIIGRHTKTRLIRFLHFYFTGVPVCVCVAC